MTTREEAVTTVADAIAEAGGWTDPGDLEIAYEEAEICVNALVGSGHLTLEDER